MSRYIDADEMLANEEQAYNNSLSKTNGTENALPGLIAHMKIQMLIKSTPAADVEPVVHAHWKIGWSASLHYMECSKCGIWTHKETRYCPYCGAHMDEEVNP